MLGIPESILSVRAAGREHRLAIWYREGDADLLVFVPGLACSKQTFREAWARSEFRDHALLALDLPGFGRSARPPQFTGTLDAQARVLSAVIDAYASRRVHLVAHSLGGSIATLMGERSLARLASFAVIEARLRRSSCGVTGQTAAISFEQFQAELLPAFRQRVAADPHSCFDVDRAEPAAFFASACSLIRHVDGDELFQRFVSAPCRKTFIYGGHNRHLSEVRSLSPELLIEIPNSGHFPMQANPQDFYSLLSGFVHLGGRTGARGC